MASRLARLLALSWGERSRLAVAMTGVGAVHMLLLLLGFRRTQALIERGTRHRNPHPADASEFAQATALARLVDIAGHHGPVHDSCLRRALLLYGWLRRRGLQPGLVFGLPAQPQAGRFQGHAWVELDGRTLLEADDAYRRFAAPDFNRVR